MVPQLLQGHGSIPITIQSVEIAANPGNALGFLTIQEIVLVAVGLVETMLQTWATGDES